MNTIEDTANCRGFVEIIIEDLSGDIEVRKVNNTVLTSGKLEIIQNMANAGGSLNITNLLVGNGGTSSGVPKVVDAGRTGLFSTTLLNKPVITSVDTSNLTVICTSVLTFSDYTGVINEFLLKMGSTPLSQVCFGDITKTNSMQITINWSVQMI